MMILIELFVIPSPSGRPGGAHHGRIAVPEARHPGP